MTLPHVPWNKRIWILSLWIYVLTDVCKWVDAIRTPEVRRAGAPGSLFVTTNRLAESDGPSPFDYDALLEKINGDFGIRSDVVEAAGQEPEYHGADTLVVPLYIPEGAVPINLARIARSGTPEPDVELVDMKVSPSADSLLIRRIGPVTGRRTSPPRRTAWRPPQRSRPVRLPAYADQTLSDIVHHQRQLRQ